MNLRSVGSNCISVLKSLYFYSIRFFLFGLNTAVYHLCYFYTYACTYIYKYSYVYILCYVRIYYYCSHCYWKCCYLHIWYIMYVFCKYLMYVFQTCPCFYKLGQLPITINLKKKKRFVSKFSFKFFFPN